MAYASLTLQMLVSAPSDVSDADLRAVQQTLNRWNFREGRRFSQGPVTVIPLSWTETAYSEFGIRPQESLNRQLVDEADLVLAMFADRLGTPTGKAESGTVEEMERMLKAGKHVSVVRSVAARSNPGLGAARERVRLEEFLAEVRAGGGLVFEYAEHLQLAGQIELMLSAQADRFLRDVTSDDTRNADDPKGVWPRIEFTETIGADENGRLRTQKAWYLILDNRTDRTARNVRHRFETPSGLPASRFDSRHTDDVIEIMAPNAVQRFPLQVSFASAGQAICVVTWDDSDGTHESRATVRTI